MADKQASSNNAEPASLGDRVLDMLGKAWDFFTGDKYLNAMARQGANELGSALKAFPDSIAEYRWVHADERDSPSSGRAPWPSQLADANEISAPNIGRGNDQSQGQDTGYSL